MCASIHDHKWKAINLHVSIFSKGQHSFGSSKGQICLYLYTLKRLIRGRTDVVVAIWKWSRNVL